jgi:hypothetical protein
VTNEGARDCRTKRWHLINLPFNDLRNFPSLGFESRIWLPPTVEPDSRKPARDSGVTATGLGPGRSTLNNRVISWL